MLSLSTHTLHFLLDNTPNSKKCTMESTREQISSSNAPQKIQKQKMRYEKSPLRLDESERSQSSTSSSTSEAVQTFMVEGGLQVDVSLANLNEE